MQGAIAAECPDCCSDVVYRDATPPLLAAVSLTVLLQLALIYIPALQTVFRTVSLSASDLALVLAVAAAVFGAVELEKWIFRRPDRVS